MSDSKQFGSQALIYYYRILSPSLKEEELIHREEEKVEQQVLLFSM